jgi:hypothetical protein
MKPKITNKPIDLNKIAINIVGSPKSGKTWLAASMSEFYGKPGTKENPTELSDMLWVPFDSDATVGLESVGYSIPRIQFEDKKETIEVWHLDTDMLIKSLDLIADQVKARVEQGGLKAIVFDTVTNWVTSMEGHYSKQLEDKPDKNRSIYNSILAVGKRFYNQVQSLPCHKIWCMHLKELAAMDAKVEEKIRRQAKTTGMPGDWSAIMDVAGQLKKVFRADTSLQLPIVSIPVGKPGAPRYEVRRNVYPHGCIEWGGIEGTNRFQHLLNYKEPADLRHIMKKIKGE